MDDMKPEYDIRGGVRGKYFGRIRGVTRVIGGRATATTKDELIELVRDLDEDGAADVLDYVRWLLADEDDPLTDDERTEVEKSEAEVARGEYVTLEQLERNLGL